MRKYVGFMGLAAVILSGCQLDGLSNRPRQEVVIVESASYDPKTEKMNLLVAHGGGCGSYHHYRYKRLDSDEKLQKATFQVILTTDEYCEAFLLGQPVEMDLPRLSFEPKRIVFKRLPEDIVVLVSK